MAIDPALLEAVLDTVIPPDPARGLPGAGSLGLAAVVGPALDATQAESLASLDGFVALGPDARSEALRALDVAQPGLVPAIHYHAIQHYYQHAQVVAALGVEAHPPFPAGFTLEPGDLSALDRVRAKGRQYRDA